MSAGGTFLAVAFNDFMQLVQVYERKTFAENLGAEEWRQCGDPIPMDKYSHTQMVVLSSDGNTVAVSHTNGRVHVLNFHKLVIERV
jgi:hypothetical protein